VKLQLLNEGIELEEYGGDVQCVHTAARAGLGLKELEEALLLQVHGLLAFRLQCFEVLPCMCIDK
jgi:translation initiation factor IF-2